MKSWLMVLLLAGASLGAGARLAGRETPVAVSPDSFALADVRTDSCATSDGRLARGEGMFVYKDYQPFADRPVDVHYYIPEAGDLSRLPIVFVFEGGDRGYTYLLDAWKEEARKRRFMVFIPHFDLKAYPLCDYQEVGVMNRQHTVVKPVDELTPVLVDKIFEYIRSHTDTQRKGYSIYGHSAGGQFVQRFMLFHDSPYVEKAVIGSPGWYTYPSDSLNYPYGVANIPYIDTLRIRNYLAKPIVLQLASGDTVRESFLRKTPEAELQGRNRLERGHDFYRYLHQLAAEHRWPCRWQKIVEQGIGHNSVQMGKQAAQALFNDSLRVLFIGNSYTFFNDMPRQLQALAASCGQKMSVCQQTHGGWRLSQHAASPQTLEAIRRGGWDFVVMQEQSKLPAREAEVVEQQMYASAASLDSITRLYNPQAQVVLYQTWGHNIPDYEQMQQRIADSYLKLAHRLDARCAPVGMAWKRVRSEKPEIGLYQDDGSHPTADGSYLAACVLYATMTGKSFHSTYWAGLTPQTAAYLQQTAQEMVLANRTIWNLTKVPQPEAVTRTSYADPEDLQPVTPTLRKPVGEGLASLAEINAYLRELVDTYPDLVHQSSLGTTPQGHNIPLLYLGDEADRRKVRVWIQGGLHGNEPAGPEAVCMLADYLLCTEEGRKLLKRVSVALVPVANPDGYALQQRRSGGGYDLNRDQTKLADPVTRLLKKAYVDWNPDVSLDVHEFNPFRKELEALGKGPTATADDVLFLSSGHPNIPTVLRSLSDDLFQTEAVKALEAEGYSAGAYFTPRLEADGLHIAKDARSPQSSATSQALNNSVSLFIEIRGIGLGRVSFARRVHCGFVVARSLLQTAASHRRQVKHAVKKALKETCGLKNKVVVTSVPATVNWPVSFISLSENKRFVATLPAYDARNLQPVLVRERPAAYVLADTCTRAVANLRALGIRVDSVAEPIEAEVERYRVIACQADAHEWEKIHPVQVETRVEKVHTRLEAGCYLVPLAQQRGNLAATLLEPESYNGFVHFNVLAVEAGQLLPVCRLLE